ncbi:MAG TPA: DNA-formamidopyrimidine glycosylase family protein [Fimbriimonadaceae bacterium]|nr:DNA-formamidopyrimidine glycosylase family protein [Fimbriimonadaceae bacterium]
MPELPDVTIYCEALAARTVGHRLLSARMLNPFVLRSVEPPVKALEDLRVNDVRRLGKRIVVCFEGDLFLVIHLMIAGRLLWADGKPKSARPGGKSTLALFQFEDGHLLLTEAGSKRRASVNVVQGEKALAVHNPGGLEPLDCSLKEFKQALRRENRTLKRALTNPITFSGIGNAYSDEILHAARLSPLQLTHNLSDEEVKRLHLATKKTLLQWTNKLRKEFDGKFPGRGQVTAFRPDFAVHGKFRQPCPVCGKKVQRISYAENETNYCAQCQHEGRMLADRSLSRLLKDDWPKTIEEMEGG